MRSTKLMRSGESLQKRLDSEPMFPMPANQLPPETLRRLIDYAHAAMGKRPEAPDEYAINSSRKPDGERTAILAVDLRALQRLGPPSWESEE